jgi:ferredoxin
MDEAGELTLPLGVEVDDAELDAVREAALGCPTEAIRLLAE